MNRTALCTTALLTLLAAGCSTTGSGSHPYALGPDDQPLARPAEDVQAAYLAYWDAFLAAYRTPGTEPPALAERTAEPMLGNLRATLAQARERHEFNQGAVAHRVVGMEADGDTRRIYDCVELSGWLVHDDRTGQEIHQVRQERRQLAVLTLARVEGTWKVTGSRNPVPCEVEGPAR